MSSSSSSSSSSTQYEEDATQQQHAAAAAAAAAESDTHFGFQTVRKADKAAMVGDVFHRVADSYDVMNDLMSAGVHRVWKEHLVSNVLAPQPGVRHLDVAGGTGDVAFRLIEEVRSNSGTRAQQLQHEQQSRVVVCDINPSMLAVGRQRALDRGYAVHQDNQAEEEEEENDQDPDAFDRDAELRFITGNAEALPFASNSFDSYSIAFGLRNVTNIERALKEAYRVLRRGGCVTCLEFSHLPNVLAQKLYDEYSFAVIPALGELVAKDRASYQYLVESIRRFPRQRELAALFESCGFRRVEYENLSLGIVALHKGFKL
jgi:2-methoxy-6-polyprenyl-1,4-benzoquinol methylase